MSLDALTEDVEEAHAALPDQYPLELDRETKQELAVLAAAFDADPGDLLRRGLHLLFQSTVDSARLDFHLRGAYDVTYEEYLSGMTYDEMTGAADVPQPEDDRRYQF